MANPHRNNPPPPPPRQAQAEQREEAVPSAEIVADEVDDTPPMAEIVPVVRPVEVRRVIDPNAMVVISPRRSNPGVRVGPRTYSFTVGVRCQVHETSLLHLQQKGIC